MEKGSRIKGWGSWRRDQEQKGGALGEEIKTKRVCLLEKGVRTKGCGSLRIVGDGDAHQIKLLRKMPKTLVENN